MTDLEYFDFKVRASEVIVPMPYETGIPDELDIDRKDAGDQESLSLTPTIIAVSEGIHNGTEVTTLPRQSTSRNVRTGQTAHCTLSISRNVQKRLQIIR